MALNYKIEYFRDDSIPTQSGLLIHFDRDVPVYMDQISIEEYSELDDDDKSTFASALFAVPGVVELGLKAYRIHIVKAEVFAWSAVLFKAFIDVIMPQFGETELNELPGSRMSITPRNGEDTTTTRLTRRQ